MIRILSIDFDYFIDVTSEERDIMFPQGADEVPKNQLAHEWGIKRAIFPEIAEIGVIEDLDIMIKYLRKQSKKSVIKIADSHKDIDSITDNLPPLEPVEIVNVDFHHDYYHYFTKGERYNCSNWLRILKEDRPNTKITWVRREDSQLESLEGKFPFSHHTNLQSVLDIEYDAIFICFSPEWTPPHLIYEYNELIESLKGDVQIVRENSSSQ